MVQIKVRKRIKKKKIEREDFRRVAERKWERKNPWIEGSGEIRSRWWVGEEMMKQVY